jgi:hypothetical protein
MFKKIVIIYNKFRVLAKLKLNLTQNMIHNIKIHDYTPIEKYRHLFRNIIAKNKFVF